ncbi:MAG TPA: transglycosylase SLT domain-containing protein [Burkholderiaceae bacterium]|nr:transglycosylase SLT domain-containing protein [Burkholderiaceae bacterium]
MANASNYAVRDIAVIGPTLAAIATFMTDIVQGALSTTRLVVMVVGTAALLAAGVLLTSDDARLMLEARLSAGGSVPTEAVSLDPGTDARDERARTADDPHQKRLVQYLARRYRVADGAVQMLVSTAFQIGREKNLDPLLILSVVAIESGLNPFAESVVGAQGLMQVMTRVHARRFEPHGGQIAALDPIANMKVGTSILHELIVRGGSVERGLQLYVGAGNMDDDGGYGARVLSERARLQMAAAGRVEAALAAAIRAAAPPPAPVPDKPATPPVNSASTGPSESTGVRTSDHSNSEAEFFPVVPEHSV